MLLTILYCYSKKKAHWGLSDLLIIVWSGVALVGHLDRLQVHSHYKNVRNELTLHVCAVSQGF